MKSSTLPEGNKETSVAVVASTSTGRQVETLDNYHEDHSQSTSTLSTALPSKHSIVTDLSSTGTRAKRHLLQSSITSHIVRPFSLSRQQKINDLIVNLIVKDLQPISIVEDGGFRELIFGLEPSYNMPSRFTFTNSFLPQKYQQKKEKLKVLLSRASAVAITTDAWTAQHNQSSYISYTAHFITEDWSLYSCLIACHQFDHSHTAENLRDDLYNVTKEWEIFDKVYTVTTDNAANIKAAIKLTEWDHIGCFAHTINLIVESGLAISDISPLRKKVKAIVEYFHRSTKANNKLIVMQQQMNIGHGQPPLKLKNSVVTRWNSTYFMFERFLKVREPLTATIGVLQIAIELLSESEWLVLNEICAILKPFEQITTEMSAEKNVTLSKVIIIVKGLVSAIQKIKQIVTTTNADSLIKHYEKEINVRFSFVEANNLMAKCGLLDPRFKMKVFISESNYQMAKDRLEKEVAQLISMERQDPKITNTDVEIEESQMEDDHEENLIWEDFDKAVQTPKKIDPKASAIIEVRSYLAENNIYRKENPLDWWKSRAAVYPHLAKLAQKCLCIMSTSVPSERVFSKAGLLISERRNRLKGKNVEMIMFLHCNQQL